MRGQSGPERWSERSCALAERQSGVIGYRQLRRARRQRHVDRAPRSTMGWLIPILHGVYAVGHRPRAAARLAPRGAAGRRASAAALRDTQRRGALGDDEGAEPAARDRAAKRRRDQGDRGAPATSARGRRHRRGPGAPRREPGAGAARSRRRRRIAGGSSSAPSTRPRSTSCTYRSTPCCLDAAPPRRAAAAEPSSNGTSRARPSPRARRRRRSWRSSSAAACRGRSLSATVDGQAAGTSCGRSDRIVVEIDGRRVPRHGQRGVERDRRRARQRGRRSPAGCICGSRRRRVVLRAAARSSATSNRALRIGSRAP